MKLYWRNWLCATSAIIGLALGIDVYGEDEKKEPPAQVEEEKTDLPPYVEGLLNRIDDLFTKDEDKVQGDVGALQSFLVHSLRYQKSVCVCGPDELARPPVVNFQGYVEALLVEDFDAKKIEKAIGVIHANRPTTPLCNPVGRLYKSSLLPEKLGNKAIQEGILKREVTLRDFAKRMPLYVAYPKGGLNERSKEEIAVYKEELNNPENKFLRDLELNIKTIPENLIGATYIITPKDGTTVVVSIGGLQAVDPGIPVWQVWIGRLKDPEIAERFEKVYDCLRSGGLILDL